MIYAPSPRLFPLSCLCYLYPPLPRQHQVLLALLAQRVFLRVDNYILLGYRRLILSTAPTITWANLWQEQHSFSTQGCPAAVCSAALISCTDISTIL
jgi:hypothetical protein